MAALNGFDSIAKIYDRLARIVFGRSIKKAQLHFINQIPVDADILILGGGTGWILNEILKINPHTRIWYVEASAEMISLSRKSVKGHGNIYFVHGTEDDIPSAQNFDVVVTNFYLDLFTNKKLHEVVGKILLRLKKDFKWIATDFVDEGKWWQRIMLKLMYCFFAITAKIDSKQLPDWIRILQKNGLHLISSKSFYAGFIKTSIFGRPVFEHQN
jgi:tRNA (cmo5U34)-methyltransferase